MGFTITNTAAIIGGIGSLFWASVGWKKGWNIIPTIGGILGIGLGLADATGLLEKLKSSSSGYAGAYQVSAANVPYDPNNYYFPPRDRSIMP